MNSCNTVEKQPDYTYTIESVWWSDSLDTNLDGYAQFRRLNFNVHLAEEVTRTVQARVYYKLKDASDFSFYAYSVETDVAGGGVNNNLFVSIGKPNKELPRGNYDFSIELYEAGSTRLEAKTDSTFLKLFNIPFEESNNDDTYSLNVWWSNQYDRSQNGYMRSATLNLDIDNNQNLTKNVDIKLYYKLSADTNYTLLNSINNYQVKGLQPDTISWQIGDPDMILERNQYDFRIDVYSSNILVAFVDKEDPVLKEVQFETLDEDIYHYTISRVWWSDSVDVDGDSYTQFRRLHFDVDVVENEQRTVFAKLFVLNPDTVSNPDSVQYEKYDSTANFQITGTSTQDSYSIAVGTSQTELDSAQYNFLLSIFEPPNPVDTLDYVAATVSGETDSILYRQKFETITQDTTKY